METPKFKHQLIDDKTNVTYHVFAYRRMSKDETLDVIRFWLSQQKRKPKRNTCVDIYTIIGAND